MKEIFDKLKQREQVFSALRETLDSESQVQVSGIIGSVL